MNGIISIYRKNKNPIKAKEMSAYMKNHFPFLGIPKPLRKEISKEFLNSHKKDLNIDWEMVFEFYNLPEREFHYLALNYIRENEKKLEKKDIINLEKLILKNSWWDSVDEISHLVGVLVLKYPDLKTSKIIEWVNSPNIWLKRVSIIFQLKYKKETDFVFLKNAVLVNNDTKEFFVDKSIGWALREYSKTNSREVKNFIKSTSLSKLSIREGSKYL